MHQYSSKNPGGWTFWSTMEHLISSNLWHSLLIYTTRPFILVDYPVYANTPKTTWVDTTHMTHAWFNKKKYFGTTKIVDTCTKTHKKIPVTWMPVQVSSDPLTFNPFLRVHFGQNFPKLAPSPARAYELISLSNLA